MPISKSQIQNLPPTNDSDGVFDGDNNLTKLEDYTCEKCEMYVFPKKRVVECIKCGRGHHFRVGDAIETPDGIVFNIKGRTCDPIPVMLK